MKRPLLYLSLISIMILTSLACSLGTVGVEWEPTPSNATPTPLADQSTSEAPVTPTASIPEGGFITGTPLDASTLPSLKGLPSSGGFIPCFVEDTSPSISLGYGIFPYESLCLNNFPTALDSPGLTVTLVDPTGRTFSESFTYGQNEIVNSRGISAGYIQNSDDIEGSPATPGVSIDIYVPASLPRGDWLVSANTQDGTINAGPTTITFGRDYPLSSVLPDLNTHPFINPLYGQGGPVFGSDGIIYFVGRTAYLPNTAVTVAFYQADPSGEWMFTAKYAASVMTDNSGNFQAQLSVGSTTLKGAYYAVAAPAITADIGLSAFDAQFAIE